MITVEQIYKLHVQHLDQISLSFARAIESIVTQEKDNAIGELESKLLELRSDNLMMKKCISELEEVVSKYKITNDFLHTDNESLKESLALAQDIIDTEPKPQQVEQSHAQASPDSVRDAALEEAAKACDAETERLLHFGISMVMARAGCGTCADLIRKLKSQAPSQSDAKNAKRYRWLRDGENPVGGMHRADIIYMQHRHGKELDEAIDASIAMVKEPQQ